MTVHLRQSFVAGFCFALLAAAAIGQEPPKPVVGLRVGEEMPFFVVDFVSGEHKDHPGCPGVIMSNEHAKGAIVLARTADDSALQMTKALEAALGAKGLGFLCVREGKSADVARLAEQSMLKKFSAGMARDQSWDRLKSLGLGDDIAIAVLLLDRKAVSSSFLLKAGELTAEKQQEIVVAAAALTK